MKRILLSLVTVGAVAALAIGASRAFFSDTEKSTGNIIKAGEIDLKIDYKGYYNKMVDGNPNAGNWELKDLIGEKFFDLHDVKPGDFGEGTISFHVYSNSAWACVTIRNLKNEENGCTDPEVEASDTTCGTESTAGELAQHIYFTAWQDLNGNNIWDSGESLLFANKKGPASDILDGRTYAIADSTTGTGAVQANQTRNIGIKWCFGSMEVNEVTHVIACNGSAEGNITQTDSLTADIEFYVEQARNNPDFRCVPAQRTELILENKDQNYNRLTNDGIYGVLTFNPNGPTFDYTLNAYKLTPSTNYSLIYYADGWPGNHPGALIASGSTDGSGNLTLSGSPDLGMDLPTSPDTNAPSAKIWLIPGSAYTNGTLSVNTWPFANDWLFETNLIKYDDTGI